MSKTIIITEQQLEELIARQFLEESLFQGQLDIKKLLKFVAKGYITALAAITLIGVAKNISQQPNINLLFKNSKPLSESFFIS